jgi:hypothetical protein
MLFLLFCGLCSLERVVFMGTVQAKPSVLRHVAAPAGVEAIPKDPPVILLHEVVIGKRLGKGASGYALEATWKGNRVVAKVRCPCWHLV